MNKTVFFNFIRKAPFGGSISQNQVEGTEFLLDYYLEKYPDWDLRWVAYLFATVFHETASTMQPIKEYGSDEYLKKKKYYPYFGRGYVQLTWENNYKKYGIADDPKTPEFEPDKALEPDTAAAILFDGMERGIFTDKKLSDYFSDINDDPVGARKIINGTDKAKLIAGYHKNFLDALKAGKDASLPVEQQTIVKPEDKIPLPQPAPLVKDPVAIATGVVGAAGGMTALISAINNPFALGAVAIIVVAVGIALYLIYQKRKDERV